MTRSSTSSMLKVPVNSSVDSTVLFALNVSWKSLMLCPADLTLACPIIHSSDPPLDGFCIRQTVSTAPSSVSVVHVRSSLVSTFKMTSIIISISLPNLAIVTYVSLMIVPEYQAVVLWDSLKQPRSHPSARIDEDLGTITHFQSQKVGLRALIKEA